MEEPRQEREASPSGAIGLGVAPRAATFRSDVADRAGIAQQAGPDLALFRSDSRNLVNHV